MGGGIGSKKWHEKNGQSVHGPTVLKSRSSCFRQVQNGIHKAKKVFAVNEIRANDCWFYGRVNSQSAARHVRLTGGEKPLRHLALTSRAGF